MSNGFRKPPTKEPMTKAIETFVESAGQPAKGLASVYPWEEASIREDVQRMYNLRLPEPYLMKLKYIAEHSPRSMQKFALDVLLPAIDEEINRLTQS